MANPVLDAYIKGVDESRQNALAGAQQQALFTTIAGAARKQQLDDAFRQEIGQAANPDEAGAIAAKYAGPQGVLTHSDTRARLQQTKEATLARLSQQGAQFDQMMQLRWQNAATAQEKNAIQAQWQQARLNLNRYAQQIAGARLYDETGIKMGLPPEVPQLAPQAAPSNLAYPQAANSPDVANLNPQERAAFDLVNSGQAVSAQGGNGIQPQIVRPAGGPAPVPAPAPQPAPVVPPAPQDPAPVTPYNMADPELRRVEAGQPTPTAPVPTAAVLKPEQPQAPQTPQMPPEIAAAPPKVQRQWLLQATKPSIAGAGTFTPETLNFVARQYLSGDRQAVQGFARSATARIQLQNAIVEEAQRQKMSPEQTAAKIADFAGTLAGARTVGTRAANISLAATEAQEMIQVVKETSDEFKRTSFVPWNMALKAYESNTGTPEVAKFGASLNALVNVYARAINPTGQPTISDKEHAREIINSVQSPQQVDAVLGIINRELEIAKKAPQTVSAARTASITGNQPNVTPDVMEKSVRARGWEYQPDKYEYRVFNGQVQRRPK